MVIKIGDRIQHGGETFVVTNIRHEQALGGMALFIQAVDPEMADHEQQKQMKVDQVNQNIIETLRRAFEQGGGGQFGMGLPGFGGN